jgi:hypothetical protein
MPRAHVDRYHQVILRCPSCGAQEAAATSDLYDAPSIVCRKCGETWPSSRTSPNSTQLALPQQRGRSVVWSDAVVVDAVRRPLVSYSAGDDDVWEARMRADEPVRRSRERSWPGILAAAISLLFLSAFFGARENAVAAIPDLAGLYRVIGLPVNLKGLAIENVSAHRKVTPTATTLIVRGDILNVTAMARSIPPLVISAGTSQAEIVEPPVTTIDGAGTLSFQYEVPLTDGSASEAVVRFAGEERVTQ